MTFIRLFYISLFDTLILMLRWKSKGSELWLALASYLTGLKLRTSYNNQKGRLGKGIYHMQFDNKSVCKQALKPFLRMHM